MTAQAGIPDRPGRARGAARRRRRPSCGAGRSPSSARARPASTRSSSRRSTAARSWPSITAATALRRSHVAQTPEGTLVANGPLVDDACELERELFEVVRGDTGPPGERARRRRRGERDRQAPRGPPRGRRACDSATTPGATCSASAGARARSRSWALLGLAGFLAAGAHDGAALGAGAALTVVTLVAKHWAGRRRRGPTVAGRRLLKAVRTERASELRAAGGQLSLAVAMFGAAALWSTDPAFAGALGIPPRPRRLGRRHSAALRRGLGGRLRRLRGCGGCG